MNDELQELKIELASFTSKVEEWMSSTKSYRVELCNKINGLLDKVSNLSDKINLLPCRERKALYESILNQIKVLWGFISAIVLLMVVEFIKRK